MIISRRQPNCLIVPLGQLGDHTKGYLGCLWCGLSFDCVRFHPTTAESVLFREDFKKPERLMFRLNLILERSKDMKLDSEQKAFIRSKVKKLGDKERVERFYNKKCEVDDYANRVAKRMFGKEE